MLFVLFVSSLIVMTNPGQCSILFVLCHYKSCISTNMIVNISNPVSAVIFLDRDFSQLCIRHGIFFL